MEKLQEYKQSQKEWRDISGNQLSNANNILLTFSSALFVFLLDKDNKGIYLEKSQNIDWNILLYWISIFFLSLSILYGFCVLITRLYDARISRHIVLTRQRFFKEHENEEDDKKELPRNDFEDFKLCDRIEILWRIIFTKLPFIKSEEISKKKDILVSFQDLRRISKVLGTATWRWTKIQFGLLLFSGLTYLISNI